MMLVSTISSALGLPRSLATIRTAARSVSRAFLALRWSMKACAASELSTSVRTSRTSGSGLGVGGSFFLVNFLVLYNVP